MFSQLICVFEYSFDFIPYVCFWNSTKHIHFTCRKSKLEPWSALLSISTAVCLYAKTILMSAWLFDLTTPDLFPPCFCVCDCPQHDRINSCVGQANHRQFLLTLLLFLLTSFYGISLVLRSICPRQSLFTAMLYCPGVYNQYRCTLRHDNFTHFLNLN